MIDCWYFHFCYHNNCTSRVTEYEIWNLWVCSTTQWWWQVVTNLYNCAVSCTSRSILCFYFGLIFWVMFFFSTFNKSTSNEQLKDQVVLLEGSFLVFLVFKTIYFIFFLISTCNLISQRAHPLQIWFTERNSKTPLYSMPMPESQFIYFYFKEENMTTKLCST